ncbi:MAG TPA: SgcJ/EcaC family oxidoreductase [bacterium]|nr:SgcJ/EcaC family oxidoreductase [bacterium]
MLSKYFAAMGMLVLLVAPTWAADTAAPAADKPAAAAPPADSSMDESAATSKPMEEAPAAPAPKAKKAHMMPAAKGGDEAGVKAAFDRFSKAWADGDAKARADVFTVDSSLINPFGQEAWGRAEVLKVFEQENATIAKGTTHTFDNFKMTFVLPNLALVDCDGTISGIKSPSGQDLPDQKLHVFVVAVKRTQVWQFRYARPTIFAPLPGSASAAAEAAPPATDVTAPPPAGGDMAVPGAAKADDKKPADKDAKSAK